MRRLRPLAAGGLPIHGHGGRERGNAFEDGATAPQSLAEEDDLNVGGRCREVSCKAQRRCFSDSFLRALDYLIEAGRGRGADEISKPDVTDQRRQVLQTKEAA